jgi:hypothetical protein
MVLLTTTSPNLSKGEGDTTSDKKKDIYSIATAISNEASRQIVPICTGSPFHLRWNYDKYKSRFPVCQELETIFINIFS